MVNRITTLSIICFLALHGATPGAVPVKDFVIMDPSCPQHNSTCLTPIRTYNALLTTYVPELFADIARGIVHTANEAFSHAADAKSLALKLKPVNQILQDQYSHNTIRSALDEALHPLLHNHPFSVQITQYMNLLILVMYEMQAQLYETQSQLSDAFEETRYLSKILANDQSLKQFLRNIVNTVTTRTHSGELSPIYIGTCHTLNDLIQTDFSMLTPRISCQPITLLEEIAALNQSYITIHFSRFQHDSLSSVKKFYELVSGAKRLRTCYTTMLHIDTTTKSQPGTSSLYLDFVHFFATYNLQKVINLHISEYPAKVYGYVLELCIQLCHLGNMPGVYDTSASNPLTDRLFKPHYYQPLWEKIENLQGLYERSPIELFGSPVIDSIECSPPQHPAPQQYLKENYPKGFKKHNPIFQLTLVTSSQALLPSLFITRQIDPVTQASQHLAIVFLPDSTTPPMKKLAAHNMQLIYQNLQNLKEHTPPSFAAEPTTHARLIRPPCSIMQCLYSLFLAPNYEEAAPLLREQPLANSASYRTIN